MKSFVQKTLLLVTLALGWSCSERIAVPSNPPVKTPESGDQGNVKPNPETQLPPSDIPVVPDSKDPPDVDPTPTDPIEPDPGKSEPAVERNIQGAIDLTSTYLRTGDLVGWAYDKNNLADVITISLYLDGDNKSGKKIGTTKANIVGTDDNHGNTHAFYFQPDKSLKDSKPHKISLYAVIDAEEIPVVTPMAYTVTLFSPKGEANNAAYAKTNLSRCGSCHGGYSVFWDNLSYNSSTGKWDADNNYLIERYRNKNARGAHKNYTICSDSACSAIREWYNFEFGK
ncbi:MAG: hypothetical protein V4655_00110 [Bdellovibrionota bacterium]